MFGGSRNIEMTLGQIDIAMNSVGIQFISFKQFSGLSGSSDNASSNITPCILFQFPMLLIRVLIFESEIL